MLIENDSYKRNQPHMLTANRVNKRSAWQAEPNER